MLFVDGVGSGMSLAPQTRLLEDIVCRRHFKMHGSGGGGGPAEEMCKDPAIQKVVAELFGWRAFFDGIPGLLLAMWFGVVADKQGRTRVFFLSLAGQVLSTCWVLFISDMAIFVLSHYRGGSTVSGAVSMIIVTDASPQKYRSNLFFYGQTAHIFAELVGPTMGSALIKNSLWQPLLLGLGLSPRVRDFVLSRLSLGLITACFAILVVAPNIPTVVIALFSACKVCLVIPSGAGSAPLLDRCSVRWSKRTWSERCTPPYPSWTRWAPCSRALSFAGIFGWSMRLNGVWKGMPYLVSFVLCGLASVALSCLGFLDSLPTDHVPAAYDEETAPLLASDIPPSEPHD
ncbi:hypothetical protein MCOR29_009947 [Pyricularia oryzae]|nr:hypothetical protein MCOR29_009947 [Pyricularia oryzae]KAI6645015.1 hypothetical protein MCOR14_000594 [Pyricularia oryzae]